MPCYKTKWGNFYQWFQQARCLFPVNRSYRIFRQPAIGVSFILQINKISVQSNRVIITGQFSATDEIAFRIKTQQRWRFGQQHQLIFSFVNGDIHHSTILFRPHPNPMDSKQMFPIHIKSHHLFPRFIKYIKIPLPFYQPVDTGNQRIVFRL